MGILLEKLNLTDHAPDQLPKGIQRGAWQNAAGSICECQCDCNYCPCVVNCVD